MNILRDISGMAILTLDDGREVEGFGTLTISQRGGMKSGRGTFQCGLIDAMAAIKSGKILSLAFADGVTAQVTVTQAGMNGLEFQSTGPVEGL